MSEKAIMPVDVAGEIIVIEQLPVIQEQLIRIKGEVERIVSDALTLEVTPETVTEIKKRRAELNKIFGEFESRRKDVKKAILSPYEQFEKTYNDCVTNSFKYADAELKIRIAAVEDGVKQQILEDLTGYFAECCESRNVDFVTFDDLGIKITLSMSVKQTKAAIMERIEKIHADVEMIQSLNDANEIMAEYKNTLDATKAIMTVKERHDAIEAERVKAKERAEAERRAKEAERLVLERMEAQQNAETLHNASLDAPVAFFAEGEQEPAAEQKDAPAGFTGDCEGQEQYAVTFTVYGTVDELRKVKAFLNDGGYRYEC